jgi:hypothetical protein
MSLHSYTLTCIRAKQSLFLHGLEQGKHHHHYKTLTKSVGLEQGRHHHHYNTLTKRVGLEQGL